MTSLPLALLDLSAVVTDQRPASSWDQHLPCEAGYLTSGRVVCPDHDLLDVGIVSMISHDHIHCWRRWSPADI